MVDSGYHPLKHHPLKHRPLKHHPLKHHPLKHHPLRIVLGWWPVGIILLSIILLG